MKIKMIDKYKILNIIIMIVICFLFGYLYEIMSYGYSKTNEFLLTFLLFAFFINDFVSIGKEYINIYISKPKVIPLCSQVLLAISTTFYSCVLAVLIFIIIHINLGYKSNVLSFGIWVLILSICIHTGIEYLDKVFLNFINAHKDKLLSFLKNK